MYVFWPASPHLQLSVTQQTRLSAQLLQADRVSTMPRRQRTSSPPARAAAGLTTSSPAAAPAAARPVVRQPCSPASAAARQGDPHCRQPELGRIQRDNWVIEWQGDTSQVTMHPSYLRLWTARTGPGVARVRTRLVTSAACMTDCT